MTDFPKFEDLSEADQLRLKTHGLSFGVEAEESWAMGMEFFYLVVRILRGWDK